MNRTRTTYMHWFTTDSGVDVCGHHTTGGNDWLPTANVIARTDPGRDHALIASIDANITRDGRMWRLTYVGDPRTAGTYERYSTIAKCLQRMGQVAVAKHAVEPQTIWFTGRDYI